jgi:hypothetical protein
MYRMSSKGKSISFCVFSALLDGQVKVGATKRVQEHNQRVKRQQKVAPVSHHKEEQGSLFTDADFEAVSKMYFVNSQKVVFKDD